MSFLSKKLKQKQELKLPDEKVSETSADMKSDQNQYLA
jgi:hypothetical protein